MAVYIVMLGPPGAGKGTQAEIVSKELGLALQFTNPLDFSLE